MTALELDALAARIAAGSGADRAVDAEFARVALGWAVLSGEWREPLFDAPVAGLLHKMIMPAPAFTDTIAGPGALFAAARRLWPDAALQIEADPSGVGAFLWPFGRQDGLGSTLAEDSHDDLCRALMLAITAAKRAEIAGGGNV